MFKIDALIGYFLDRMGKEGQLRYPTLMASVAATLKAIFLLVYRMF